MTRFTMRPTTATVSRNRIDARRGVKDVQRTKIYRHYVESENLQVTADHFGLTRHKVAEIVRRVRRELEASGHLPARPRAGNERDGALYQRAEHRAKDAGIDAPREYPRERL